MPALAVREDSVSYEDVSTVARPSPPRPANRDPQRFPVCPTCKEIYEGLRPPEDGEG